MEMIIIYPIFIGIAVVTAQLAHNKGYSARWWFLIAMLLPVVSLPVLFALKKRPKSQSGYYAPVDNTTKDKVLFKR